MKLGIIVGRFQVPYLHTGHVALLQYVKQHSDRVMVFLGVSQARNTRENPLDFVTRSLMLRKFDANIMTLAIEDCSSDAVWCTRLNEQIARSTSGEHITLYGSAGSFIDTYRKQAELSGRGYGAIVTPFEATVSGTALREAAAKTVMECASFRTGAIHAAYQRYPAVHTTVDIAVFKHDFVLLVRKPNESQWRFPGGFADPQSPSFEADAHREMWEECGGIDVGGYATGVHYVGSRLQADWRYSKGVDKVKTILFTADYISGAIKAGDDVEQVDWIEWVTLSDQHMVPEHRPLKEMMSKYRKEKA